MFYAIFFFCQHVRYIVDLGVYLEELAALFHRFYTECRIIGSDKRLAQARIALCVAVQVVLRNGLSILGVNAPEKM